jgi:hypothetical protein
VIFARGWGPSLGYLKETVNRIKRWFINVPKMVFEANFAKELKYITQKINVFWWRATRAKS